MPYTIVHTGNEYCVHKMDADEKPMGETLGCHDTREEAAEQIGAIEAEERKSFARPTQDEAHFKSLADSDVTCKSCRFLYDDGLCYLIQNTPADITEKSVCDRHEAKPGASALPVGIPAATAPATNDVEVGYIAPQQQKNFLRGVMDKLRGGLEPGVTVVKANDGKRYMFIITSNSFQDRQQEWLTSHALMDYVESSWKAADYFAANNPQLVWHHDGLAVGDIIWADMAGPFLIEVARERPGIVAKTAYDYWETTSEALGASFRFQYRKADRDADGAYHAIQKTETSTLPREAAANLLTFSGVIPMTTRNDYLDKMFGVPGVAELLKEGPEKLAAALTAKGVAHKAAETVDPAVAVEATEKVAADFGGLMSSLISAQADIFKAFDDLKADVASGRETQQKEYADFLTRYKALEDENAVLRAEMKLSPRASMSPATALKGADKTEAELAIEEKTLPMNDLMGRMKKLMEAEG